MRGWHDARLAFLISLRRSKCSALERNSIANSINAAQRGAEVFTFLRPLLLGCPHTRKGAREQGALAAPLQRIDLEWLLSTVGLVHVLASLMQRSASCRWSSEVSIPERYCDHRFPQPKPRATV